MYYVYRFLPIKIHQANSLRELASRGLRVDQTREGLRLRGLQLWEKFQGFEEAKYYYESKLTN